MSTTSLDLECFAARLNQAMAAAGVDRNALAAAVAAHPNRVGDWMRGARWPAIEHLVAVATTLGVEIDWLLTGRRGGGQPLPINRGAVQVARELARLAPRLVPLAERARRVASRG